MDPLAADLHTHTSCSDGRLSPEELVSKAAERGLRAVAVTDHDTVDALDRARAAGREHGVEVVAGVELSVTVERTEVHLLGYFFDPENAELRAHFDSFRRARYRRAEQMVARLQDLGVPLSFDRVLEQANGAALGRPHVAFALVEEGFSHTFQTAFDRFLRDGGPACVPKPAFSARAALRMLHEAGGIGVLAHPGHWTSDRVIRRLIRAGLDGIETIHPSHDASLTAYYRDLVKEFGLLETGGSDYHGFRPTDEANFGRYTIPYPQLERIRRPAA